MTDRYSGHILRPRQAPEKVDLTLDRIKDEYDSVTVTGTTYTVKDKTYIFCDDDTAGAGITITLPPVIENTDKIVVVKKLGTTGNITVDGNGSETIDGATTQTISSQYGVLRLVCSGAVWWTW